MASTTPPAAFLGGFPGEDSLDCWGLAPGKTRLPAPFLSFGLKRSS